MAKPLDRPNWSCLLGPSEKIHEAACRSEVGKYDFIPDKVSSFSFIIGPGDGSYLKKLTSPPKGGGRSGNFRGSKNQKSGKCHELSRQSIKFVFLTHPTPGGSGGGGGQHFKSPLNFMNCRENLLKNSPPPKGVAVGILGGQKIKSPGNELPRKVIKKIGS